MQVFSSLRNRVQWLRVGATTNDDDDGQAQCHASKKSTAESLTGADPSPKLDPDNPNLISASQTSPEDGIISVTTAEQKRCGALTMSTSESKQSPSQLHTESSDGYKISISTKSLDIWKFPGTLVWVARQRTIALPSDLESTWPALRNRVLIDLKVVADEMIAKQAKKKTCLEQSPKERRMIPEMRMSGVQETKSSDFVTISPCIWILCGSEWCRDLVRKRMKKLNYAQDLFGQSFEIHEGAPVAHAKRMIISIPRLQLDLDRNLGLEYFGGVILHHIETHSEAIVHRSACGLLCCSTFWKDGRVLVQHVSRVGGLLTKHFGLYTDIQCSIAMTTSHGIFEDLMTTGPDIEFLERLESLSLYDEGPNDEHSLDTDPASSSVSSSSPESEKNSATSISPNAYWETLGEKPPAQVSEWLSLDEVFGIKFAQQRLPERCTANVTGSSSSKPGDYALLGSQKLASLKNIFSLLPEGEITSHLTNVELTEGVLSVVFGVDDTTEAYLVPGSVEIPLGMEVLTVRKVELIAPLAAGTSGTWLIRGSALAGMIVAAYPGQPLALFVTAQDLLENISNSFPEDTKIHDRGHSVQVTGANDKGQAASSGGDRETQAPNLHSGKDMIEEASSVIIQPRSRAPNSGTGETTDNLKKRNTTGANLSESTKAVPPPRQTSGGSALYGGSCPVYEVRTTESRKGKGRKTYLWTCINCGDSGMSIMIDHCPSCGWRRC